MRQTTLFIASFLLLSLVSLTSSATERECIHIVTQEWAGETNRDGSGLYFDLLRAVYTPLKIDLCIKITPYNRAIYMLRNKTADASIDFYQKNVKKKTEEEYFLNSIRPIGRERLVAIFKKTTIDYWNFPQSLENRRVASIGEYGLEKKISVPFAHRQITSSAQGWNLLQRGRIDILVDSYSDSLTAAITLGSIDLQQYEIKTVSCQTLFVTFAKSSQGRTFKRLFDQRMEELRQSDELARIYHAWGRELPPPVACHLQWE